MLGGRIVRPEFRLTAEDFAVAVLRLRLASGFTGGAGRGNDCRDIEGVSVDWYTTFEHREGESFGFQRTFVDGQVGGELSAGGMAHDNDTVRVAAEFAGVVVRPAERLSDIGEDLVHRGSRDVAMVRRNEDVAQVREELRLQLHAGLLATTPAAAVNPKDDRRGLG